jgi:hypothetical protein
MNAITETLKTAEVISTRTNGNLTVHFLCIKQARPMNLLGFKDAMNAGALQVAEIGEGTVSELCLTNTSTMPVFIPEGTIIENLKQSHYQRQCNSECSMLLRGKNEVVRRRQNRESIRLSPVPLPESYQQPCGYPFPQNEAGLRIQQISGLHME